MPRYIVELYRHTVRIRSATIQVEAPSEEAIMEEDWTLDDTIEWEDVPCNGNSDEAETIVEIDTNPTGEPDVDLT